MRGLMVPQDAEVFSQCVPHLKILSPGDDRSGQFFLKASRETIVRSCWGSNMDGMLGRGTVDNGQYPDHAPVVGFASLAPVASITGGENFTCALTPAGSIKCWGSNGTGQLGAGKTFNQLPNSPSAVAVVTAPNGTTPLTSVLRLAAGDAHACAVMADGTLRCWGQNTYGELGYDPNVNTSSNGPVQVAGLSSVSVTSVSVGGDASCALTTTGDVYCWGVNSVGQLGSNLPLDTTPHPTPRKVPLPLSAIAIASGNTHTCAVLTSGQVYCWGGGDKGQLGDGNGAPSASPVWVPSLSNMVQVTAGRFNTCALSATGIAFCWGDNSYGALGTGKESSALNIAKSPVPVVTTLGGTTPFTGLVGISAGGDQQHTCAVRSDGQAFCWGENSSGALGNGQSGGGAYSTVPVNVHTSATDSSPLSDVLAVGGGGMHACALLVDGSARCWGFNSSGQLGNGSASPTPIPNPVGVSQFP